MDKLTRSQIKKDELTEIIFSIAEWIKINRTLFLSVAATVIGILILSIFVLTRLYALRVRSADKVAIAQGQLYQGQTDQALSILNEVIAQYSNTRISFKARMVKTDYLISQQKYEEAEEIIKPVVENGKPVTIVPLAISTLGAIYENSAQYDKAIKTYNMFLEKYPNHFLAPKIYESLARVYELNGSPAEASSTYEKLATLYPNSVWANNANSRIIALPKNSQAAH